MQPERPIRGLSRALALAVFWGCFAASASPQQTLPSAADVEEHLASAVRSAGLRKVLVADFLDSAGARTENGVYLAASFAKEFSQHASGFALADRWAWFSLLEKKMAAPADSAQPGGVHSICAALGCDGVISGRWTQAAKSFHVRLELRSAASGQTLAEAAYRLERTDASQLYLPAPTDASGIRFYFAG